MSYNICTVCGEGYGVVNTTIYQCSCMICKHCKHPIHEKGNCPERVCDAAGDIDWCSCTQ